MRPLTDRQRRALGRLLRERDGHLPMDRSLANQLVRRGIVRISDHVYEQVAWGKVVVRLPVVALAISPDAAQRLVETHA